MLNLGTILQLNLRTVPHKIKRQQGLSRKLCIHSGREKTDVICSLFRSFASYLFGRARTELFTCPLMKRPSYSINPFEELAFDPYQWQYEVHGADTTEICGCITAGCIAYMPA